MEDNSEEMDSTTTTKQGRSSKLRSEKQKVKFQTPVNQNRTNNGEKTKSGKKQKRKVKPEDFRSGGCDSSSNKSKSKRIKQRVRSRAGYHKDKYYIDSGASNSMLFNREVLDDIDKLNNPKRVACGGNDIEIHELGCLKKALQHLPLPKDGYYYDKNVVANLLSLGKIANEFRVVMYTEIDDAIYVYGKDGKYLRFAKTTNNLYCMELRDDEEKEDCFFGTVKRKKAMSSKMDVKRAEAVRNSQERPGFPSDRTLAKSIEYNILGTY